MIQADVSLTLEEQNFIDNHVLGNEFPWFRVPYQTEIKLNSIPNKKVINSPFFANILVQRSEKDQWDSNVVPTEPGIINSSYYDFFYRIFDKWMREQSLDYTMIFRGCVNCVQSKDYEVYANPHVDHFYPHNVWIMYLNSTDGPTVLFDDDFNIVKEIPCEKNTAVSFSSQLHAYKFPIKEDQRFIVLFTYI